MRLLSTIAIAALTVAGWAGAADAFTFSPPGVSFSATGSVTLIAPTGGSIKCGVSAKGLTTKAGAARITSFTFVPGDAACANTAATALPWPALATAAHAGKLNHVAYTGAFTGSCGPGHVHFTDNAAGVWTFTNAALPPSCTISATLNTSPPIIIVP